MNPLAGGRGATASIDPMASTTCRWALFLLPVHEGLPYNVVVIAALPRLSQRNLSLRQLLPPKMRLQGCVGSVLLR